MTTPITTAKSETEWIALKAERDALEKACAELLSYATMLANDTPTETPAWKMWNERDHQPQKPWGSDYVHRSELAPDKARLDWMDNQVCLVAIATDGIRAISNGLAEHGRGETFRTAIDRAMASAAARLKTEH